MSIGFNPFTPVTRQCFRSRAPVAPALPALALGALLIASAAPAFAQTASQVTQPSYAPPVMHRSAGGLIVPATSGLDAPAGAEKLTVTPAGLSIEGELPGVATETARIATQIKGKQVTGADLFAAARNLEAAYARAGFLLARVTLPPQTIRDGMPLKLVVTDGYVESVDLSALPPRVRGHVEAMLQPLVGKRGLRRHELERLLLLASDTPGLTMRSTLKAGTKPGGTVIVIDGNYDPLTAFTTFDNDQSKSLGRYSLGVGVNFNDLLGLGEVGYLTVQGYPGANQNIFTGDPRSRQIVGGVTVPLGTDGAWLNLEGVDSRTDQSTSLGYTVPGHFQRFSTKVGYNWLRSRDANMATIFDFDIADETQKIDADGATFALSDNRLRVLRVTQTADLYTSQNGRLQGSLTASFGLDAFGAREATTDLPMSRQGASPDFQRLQATATYTQGFAQNRMMFSLAGAVQTSFGDPLASSEQMALGGMDWLSAYASGDIEADTGAVVRAEMSLPMTTPVLLSANPTVQGTVSPYIFAAGGVAKLEEPTAVEAGVTRAASLGAGIRLALQGTQNVNDATILGFEYAHGAASGIDHADRFNMRLTAKF